MGPDGRLARFIRAKLRAAGRQVGEAERAYREARTAPRVDLPREEDGRVRIVCRRYVEKRAVELDAEARPECFDPEHDDCRGCAEDIRDGIVETW